MIQNIAKKTAFIFALCLASLDGMAQNQFMAFDQVCWDSAGVKIGLVQRTYWVNGVGQVADYRNPVSLVKIVPTVGTVTLGPCGGNSPLDSIEANVVATLNSFSGAADTIAANSASHIVIENLGTGTHSVFVDGTNIRLYPGESYRWTDYYDRLRGVWVYNPQIIIAQGISGVNNTRKVVTPKNY